MNHTGSQGCKGALGAVSGAFQPTHFCPTPCCTEAGALLLASDVIEPSLDQATHPDSCKRGCPVGADDDKTVGSVSSHVNHLAYGGQQRKYRRPSARFC